MVCYFILCHLCMIGSHRRVRRRGRKPEDSHPTRGGLEEETEEAPAGIGDRTGEPESPPESLATAPANRVHRRKSRCQDRSTGPTAGIAHCMTLRCATGISSDDRKSRRQIRRRRTSRQNLLPARGSGFDALEYSLYLPQCLVYSQTTPCLVVGL